MKIQAKQHYLWRVVDQDVEAVYVFFTKDVAERQPNYFLATLYKV